MKISKDLDNQAEASMGGNLTGSKKFIGAILERKYEIESLIGAGGTGFVFKGKNILLDIPVAIKILNPKLVENEVAIKRFKREARLSLSINHPNSVSMMDFGLCDDNTPYIVMEYISGDSLADLLSKEKRLSFTRSINIMKQVCSALEFAHQKSIIHRDLKPGNIMILDCGQPQESIKVIDFSIAKSIQGNDEFNLTGKGVMLGTPQYVSPEQAQGIEIDWRADIYSLGIITFQMLTGELPFTGKMPVAVLMKHVHSRPPLPRSFRSEIPVKLEKAILKALEKEPAQRPQSALAFAELLEQGILNMSAEDDNRASSMINTTDSSSYVEEATYQEFSTSQWSSPISMEGESVDRNMDTIEISASPVQKISSLPDADKNPPKASPESIYFPTIETSSVPLLNPLFKPPQPALPVSEENKAIGIAEKPAPLTDKPAMSKPGIFTRLWNWLFKRGNQNKG